MEFGWDESKRQAVLADRNIDFADMTLAFDGRLRITVNSPRNNEDRRVSIANINGRFHAVIWMLRGSRVWIITARRALAREERQFNEVIRSLGGRDNGQH